MTRLAALALPLALAGCLGPAALAGVSTGLGIANAGIGLYTNALAAVAQTRVLVGAACRDVPAAAARSAALVAAGRRTAAAHASLVAYGEGMCRHVATVPVDDGSPAWVGGLVARMEGS